MKLTPHRLTIIPGKKTPAQRNRAKSTGKPPDEWTLEDTSSALEAVGEIHFLLTQLATAQREGRRKPECARCLRRALEALFHSAAAAAVVMWCYG